MDTLVEPALSGAIDFDAPAIEPRRFEPLPDSSTPFVIELSQFSGPLDLLLSLIRDEQVDIYDIPIARITDSYMDYVSHLREFSGEEGLDINLAGEFLVMAATLM